MCYDFIYIVFNNGNSCFQKYMSFAWVFVVYKQVYEVKNIEENNLYSTSDFIKTPFFNVQSFGEVPRE